MGEWHTIDRVTICDATVRHEVRSADLGEYSEEYPISIKVKDDGSARVYLPAALAPAFDETGRYCIASHEGEVLCNRRVEKPSLIRRGGLLLRKYTTPPP